MGAEDNGNREEERGVLSGSPQRARIRKQRHALQLAREFDLRQEGDWVYSIVDPADSPKAAGPRSFTPGYRSWAPAVESGLVHGSSGSLPEAPDRDGMGEEPAPYALIVSYTGDQRCVEVPAEIGGYVVRQLHNKVFAGNKKVVEVVFPDTVVHIGLKTFHGCTNLARVSLSDGISQLDALTFSGCTRLGQVKLPASLKVIERKLLASCPVGYLVIPAGVEEVQDRSVDTCALERIDVDEANRVFSSDGLGLYSKDGSTFLKLMVEVVEYSIAAGCTAIADGAFRGLASLRSVGLGQVASIGAYAFFGTGIEQVELGGCMRLVGERAFFQSEELSLLSICEGVEEIGPYAFAKTAVRDVAVPRSVRRIGEGAFSQSGVVFGAEATFSIDDGNGHLATDGYALYENGAEGLCLASMLCECPRYKVMDGTVYIRDRVFANAGYLESVLLPEGLKAVGRQAFAECGRLSQLDLPDTVEEIGDEALAGSGVRSMRIGSGLASIGHGALRVRAEEGAGPGDLALNIELSGDNKSFYAEDGFLCERRPGGSTALAVVSGNPTLRMPRSVNGIGAYAFNGADIGHLYLHCGLEHADARAFHGLRGLRQASIERRDENGTYRWVRVEFPYDSNAAEGAARCMGFDDQGAFFRFSDYDTWVIHYWLLNKRNSATVARMILARLDDPVQLTAKARREFENAMKTILFNVFRYYTRQRDFSGFERLERHGFLDADALEGMLEDVQKRGETEASGYLMEMKRRKFGFDEGDYSL